MVDGNRNLVDDFDTYPSIIVQLIQMIMIALFTANNSLFLANMTSVPVTVSIISQIDFNFHHHVGRRGYHRPLNVGFACRSCSVIVGMIDTGTAL